MKKFGFSAKNKDSSITATKNVKIRAQKVKKIHVNKKAQLGGSKNKLRLSIEYIVTYRIQCVVFRFYNQTTLVATFDYKLVGENDKENLSSLYYDTLVKIGQKPFEECDIIMATYDTTVVNMKKKNNLFSGNSVIKNYLTDILGADYQTNYEVFIDKIGLPGGYSLYSFFCCGVSRVLEIETLLSELGMKKFRISFLPTQLNGYLKNHGIKNRAYLLIRDTRFQILCCINEGRINRNFFICPEIEFNDQEMPLSNLNNVFLALSNEQDSIKEGSSMLYVVGEPLMEPFDSSILTTTHIDELTFEKLASRFVPGTKHKTMKKKNVVVRKKKFDWNKFLGIKKKGFTLMESVASIAIFAIVATITLTFLIMAQNNNFEVKCRTLATSYLSNVSNSFHVNPSEENVRNITQYNEEELYGHRHYYYLNGEMDFKKPSSTASNMTFQVMFEYYQNSYVEDEQIIQDYTKFTFTIVSINKIGGTKSYIDQVSFVQIGDGK